jgi:hypothetical protein
MINFTYNNHLKFYINEDLYGVRSSPLEKFKVTLGAIDADYYLKNNYSSELRRIADIQHKDFGKEKIIFLSGGLDSEIVVRSFINIGIKPKLATIRFENNYNDFEVLEAERIAKELECELIYIDLNIIDFYLSGEAEEISKKYMCNTFAFVVFIKAITLINSPSIFGFEVELVKKRDKQDYPVWRLRIDEYGGAAMFRFSKCTNIPVISEWFTYTPELLLYFLETPEIQMLTGKRSYYQNSAHIKNSILKSLVEEIKDSEKIKKRGFEKINALNIEANWRLDNLMPFKLEDNNAMLSYSNAVNMLKGII